MIEPVLMRLSGLAEFFRSGDQLMFWGICVVRLQNRSLRSRLGRTQTDSGRVTEPRPEGAVAVTRAPPERLRTIACTRSPSRCIS
jgi:hypothetical protein